MENTFDRIPTSDELIAMVNLCINKAFLSNEPYRYKVGELNAFHYKVLEETCKEFKMTLEKDGNDVIIVADPAVLVMPMKFSELGLTPAKDVAKISADARMEKLMKSPRDYFLAFHFTSEVIKSCKKDAAEGVNGKYFTTEIIDTEVLLNVITMLIALGYEVESNEDDTAIKVVWPMC